MLDAAADRARSGGIYCDRSTCRASVDRSLAAVFSLRMDGRIEDCNPALARMLGCPSPSAVAARPAWECDAGTGPENLAACLLRNRNEPRTELSLTRADGAPVWLLVAVTDVLDHGGSALLLASAIDITEAKRASRKAGRLSRVCEMLSALHRRAASRKERLRLLQDACNIAVDTGGFAKVCVTLFDRETGALVPGAQAIARGGPASPAPVGRDCPALAPLREGRPFVSQDIAADPRVLPLQRGPALSGLRSAAVLPVRAWDRVAGGLWLFSAEPGDFDPEIVAALSEFALHIGFCLQATHEEATSSVHSRAEARFRELLEAAPDAILETDRAGTIVLVNAAAERIFGYTRDELIGQSTDVLVPENLRAVHARWRTVYVSDPVSRTIERAPHLRGRRKDGTEFPVEISLSPVRSRSGDFITCIVHDISHREQAEQALRESTRQIASILESIADGFFALDRDWRFSYLNRKAEQLFARSRADLIGRTIWEEFPALAGSVFDSEYRKAVANQVPVEFSAIFPPLGIWAEIHASPSANGLSIYIHDITERKHLEERLQQSEKLEALGRLAGGVAHDFNNLLTIIGGYGQMILEAAGSRDPVRKNVATIVEAANRASALTRQLLAFSRRQMVQPKLLDLNRVVEKMNAMLRRLIREDVELVLVLEPGVGQVKIDPIQLEQVVMNLVVNARDAMPTGGALTIATKVELLQGDPHGSGPSLPPGRYAVLSVTDTGTGMDTAVLSRIFEPFFTTKAKHKGTGLGLATVYGIVKQSGGDILVQSQPGRGTCFRIFLPREERNRHTARPGRASRKSHRGTETILLVEDEPEVRRLACDMLCAQGYKVVEAAGGAEALRIWPTTRSSVDLLVTDVIMPQMSGAQLADKLTAEQPGLKVLYVSGYTDDIIARHGIGPDALLQKPFTRKTLAAKVRNLLDSTP